MRSDLVPVEVTDVWPCSHHSLAHYDHVTRGLRSILFGPSCRHVLEVCTATNHHRIRVLWVRTTAIYYHRQICRMEPLRNPFSTTTGSMIPVFTGQEGRKGSVLSTRRTLSIQDTPDFLRTIVWTFAPSVEWQVRQVTQPQLIRGQHTVAFNPSSQATMDNMVPRILRTVSPVCPRKAHRRQWSAHTAAARPHTQAWSHRTSGELLANSAALWTVSKHRTYLSTRGWDPWMEVSKTHLLTFVYTLNWSIFSVIC